jgi:hypothetical protein
MHEMAEGTYLKAQHGIVTEMLEFEMAPKPTWRDYNKQGTLFAHDYSKASKYAKR